MADFLGWLEIIRRDMQFLDLGAVDQTRELNTRIAEIQRRLSSTTDMVDPYYLYRANSAPSGN
ncbi:MAG: hypothetical protein JST91_22750 [Actinobacteria bacterium]|nr:hypothetical protein [Actinomycetota bacterium]